MALDAEPNSQRMSMDDIAASMIVSSDPIKEDETDAVDTTEEEGIELEATDSADAEVVEDDSDNTDSADNEDDENFETIQLTDDMLVTVTVDGESKEVTLADLKRSFSGEGAIDKRLQIATETKKQAESLKVQVEQELNTGRQNLVKAFTAFEGLMFQPQITQPDPALMQSNPTQYLMQMELYREEQVELQQKRGKVQQAFAMYQQQEAQQKQQMQADAAQKLVEAMPALRDPVKGPELQKLMVDGARDYGFQDAELAEIVDHRMLIVLADAAAYRKLKAQGQAKPKVTSRNVPVMRPGAANNVAAATSAARKQKAALETARQTGRLDDVAKTMLVRKPKR